MLQLHHRSVVRKKKLFVYKWKQKVKTVRHIERQKRGGDENSSSPFDVGLIEA